MINGDVDLTSNLDFYHDKENNDEFDNFKSPIAWRNDSFKEIQSTPQPISVTETNYNINIRWNNITNFVTYSTADAYTTLSLPYNSGWTNSYEDDSGRTTDSSRWATDIQSDSNDYITINLNPINTNYITTATFTNSTYDNMLSYTSPLNNSYSISTSWKTIGYTYTEKKCTIFGPRKANFDKYTSPMHYNSCCNTYTLGKCKCKDYDESYKAKIFLWTRENDKSYEEDENAYEIAERFRSNSKRRDIHREESTGNYNPERKIPWLRRLMSRIYHDYIDDLKEEQDYSKYLTDMGWLRIN